MKVETEKKYYCLDPMSLIKIAEQLNFKKIEETEETDEYFTDINSKFIKNRTCLRIRKENNKNMEITYKGKSDSLLGLFCKLENNIKCNIEDYSNYISLLSALGYYSYVVVNKKRLVYELDSKKYKYSIMLDTLPEIGGFVEFEILSEQIKSTKNELQKELDNFINKFKILKLKEAVEPYRDIVAKHILNKLFNKKNISSLCINLDTELIKYEKDFFKKYKDKISNECGYNVKWGEYKRNTSLNNKLLPIIEEYINDLIFDGKNLLVTMELLNKIKYDKYFFTKVSENFCNSFLNKFNISNQNIIYIKNNDSIVNILSQNEIPLSKSIIINNDNFKDINSLLLIIINESK